MGTPAGSSHSGAIAGSCAAGVVKRELGCAAGWSASGVQSLPCQSMACAGGSLVMPSHQTSPSSVSAQLVKIELARMVAIALRIGHQARVRRDAEEARLGVDRVEAPVLAELHPRDVVADRLDRPVLERRDQHREVGLAARAREGARDVLDAPVGRGELEDQHVLGHPALVAGHDRGDAQGQALLAQQRVAAVARAERPDLARSRGSARCTCCRRCTATARPRRHRRAACRPSAGRARSRRPRRAPRAAAAPIRVMIRMRDGHVGRVGALHADVALVGAQRAHREGHDVHRAALHRAAEEVGERLAHLRRGRASCSSARRRPRGPSR